MSVERNQRHSRRQRCPICGGADQDPRGQGVRCAGYTSADGQWCRCSREEKAGHLEADEHGLYRHLMYGECRCGQTHRPARSNSGARPNVDDVEATYDYRDESGQLLFQVVRKTGKRFTQRRPVGDGWEWKLDGVRRVLYRLPDLLAAPKDATIWVAEGEKDVDALWRVGLVATCNPHGAGKWRSIDNEQSRALFRGRDVVILPDADTIGEKHAKAVASWMANAGATAQLVRLPVHDAFDFLSTGSVGALQALRKANGGANVPSPVRPALAVGGGGWEATLLRKPAKGGGPGEAYRPIGANVATILVHDPRWANVLSWDEFAESIVTRKVPPWRDADMPLNVKPGDWSDADTARAHHWLSENYTIDVPAAQVEAGVLLAARRQTTHRVREELSSFKWDGSSRMSMWLSVLLGVEDSPYTRECATIFLVSAVARAFRPGCKVDTVLILEGEQGALKSSVLRALAGDELFLEMSVANIMSTDAMQVLRRKWIIEFPEVDGYTRGEQSHLKGWISRQVDTYRQSYGRFVRDYPRQMVATASTNKTQYLSDETGARRFMPVICREGNLGAARGLREQLWAEAVEKFNSGMAWHVTDPELLDQFKEQQEARYRAHPWEEIIGRWLEQPSDVGKPRSQLGVTTADVLRFAVKQDDARITQADAMTVAACLRRLGWELGPRARRGGVRVRLYFPATRPPVEVADREAEPDEVAQLDIPRTSGVQAVDDAPLRDFDEVDEA